MAVSSSLCSLRHWVKCSVVSCCSPTAEYRPLSLIHSVNKTSLAWLTCPAANQVAKTASPQPIASGGAGRAALSVRREGGPKRELKEQSPLRKTSSLLSPSFVPCCRLSWLNLLLCIALCMLNNDSNRFKVIADWFSSPISLINT